MALSTRKHVASHTHLSSDIVGSYVEATRVSGASTGGYSGGLLNVEGVSTQLTPMELVYYIWEYVNGVWTPSAKTIPVGESFIRFKDETSGYAIDIMNVIVNDSGTFDPNFVISGGVIVKRI